MKLAKNQANDAKEPRSWTFETFNILKYKEKDKCVYIYTINHKENEDENEK